jgi:hypothetical protein
MAAKIAAPKHLLAEQIGSRKLPKTESDTREAFEALARSRSPPSSKKNEATLILPLTLACVAPGSEAQEFHSEGI